MYAFMYLFVCWLFLKYWFLIPDIHSRAHIPKLLPFIFALWQPTRQWTFFSDLWVIFHCHSRLPQGTRALMGYYVKPYKTQSAWKKYVVGFIHLVYLFFCLSACLSIFVSDSFRWRDWYWSIEVLTIDGQDRQKDVSVYICVYINIHYIYIYHIWYTEKYAHLQDLHRSRSLIPAVCFCLRSGFADKPRLGDPFCRFDIAIGGTLYPWTTLTLW